MDEEELYECGVDISSEMRFIDGDVQLSAYDTNLAQAVANRLNTQLNELDLFYDTDYGSVLMSFLGWKRTDETLVFVKSEIDNVLSKEPRLLRHTSEVSYDEQGRLKIELGLFPNDSVELNLNLVLTANGVVDLVLDEEDLTE